MARVGRGKVTVATAAYSGAPHGLRSLTLWRARLLPILIAATPLIFAVSTWNPALDDNALANARSFGLPVLGVETIVLLWAMLGGFTLREAWRRFSGWQQWLLAALGSIALFDALLVAPDRSTAMARTCATILHVAFALAAADLLRRSAADVRRTLWPLVAGGMCAYVALVPIYLAAIPDRASFDWVHLGLAVINVRQVGFYTAIGGAAAIGLALFSDRRRSRLFWAAVAALGFALSSWSGTRGAIVAVPVAVTIVVWLVPAIPRIRALATTLGSLVAGALASLVFIAPDPVYGLWRMSSSISSGDISTGRWNMWLGTIRGIADRPLFGHGESQFRLLVPEAIFTYNHPHNLILQLAFQWGIVGLACVALLGAAAMRDVVGAVRRMPVEGVPALLVLVCLLVFSMYEGTGYHPYPVMMTALSLSYLLTTRRGDCSAREPHGLWQSAPAA